MSENNRSFYAILPAYVRYDEELSSTAKLLFAEITALSNQLGYCWANNKYFMDCFKISLRQLQKILKQLSDKNYIKIEIENKNSRKIFINDSTIMRKNIIHFSDKDLKNNRDKKFRGTLVKNDQGDGQKVPGTLVKNDHHNNITNNKNIIEKKENQKLFDYDWLNDKS